MIILVDLHGTLTQEARFVHNILWPTCMEFGIKADYLELKRAYNKAKLGNEEEILKIAGKEAIFAALRKVRLREGAKSFLRDLMTHGTLVLFSDFPESWGEYLVKRLGISSFFSHIIFSSEIGSKRKRETFEKLLRERNWDPKDVILVDDKEANLRAAGEAGIKCFLFEGFERTLKKIKRFMAERERSSN